MSVRETDRELRVRQPRPIRERASAAWALPHRFDRNSTSASNMNSNRGGTARRRRGGSRGCFCCRLAPEARIAAGGAPDSGCLLLEGSALPRAPHPSARHHERRNGRRRRHHPLWLREHCGECAGCPDGDRTGTCQHILLKAGGGELASRSADLPRDLRRLVTARATGRIFPAPYLII